MLRGALFYRRIERLLLGEHAKLQDTANERKSKRERERERRTGGAGEGVSSSRSALLYAAYISAYIYVSSRDFDKIGTLLRAKQIVRTRNAGREGGYRTVSDLGVVSFEAIRRVGRRSFWDWLHSAARVRFTT